MQTAACGCRQGCHCSKDFKVRMVRLLARCFTHAAAAEVFFNGLRGVV